MQAKVHYDEFNTSYKYAEIPIDDEKRAVIESRVITEDAVNEEGDTEQLEKNVLVVTFEDDALSNKIELTLDEEDFPSFIKLLQLFARNHLNYRP